MRWVAAAVLFVCAWLGDAPTALGQRSNTVLSDPRLDAVRTDLERSVGAARREGLPDEWLLDRVAEGLSKHVPPPQINRAVGVLLDRMRAADRLVDLVPSAGGQRIHILRAAVDALAAGAPEVALGRLVREVVRLDRAQSAARTRDALVTVAELAERDFGGPASVDAATEAYTRGRRTGLAQLLENARRIGVSPPGGRDDALRRVGRDVGRGAIDRSRDGRDHDQDVHPRQGLR